MGWWGYNIMEGDTPLDCEGDIIEFLADPALVEAQNDDNYDEMADKIQASGYEALKNKDSVLNAFTALTSDELCGYDSEIAMQVFGEMIMCSGGVMPVAVRCTCIAAAKSELDESNLGWRDGGNGREQCLYAYIKRVGEYVDGVPFEPTSEGLFAKVFA